MCCQTNLEMLGALRERQMKLKEDALVLQEQMTEFRNNVIKEVKGKLISYNDEWQKRVTLP